MKGERDERGSIECCAHAHAHSNRERDREREREREKREKERDEFREREDDKALTSYFLQCHCPTLADPILLVLGLQAPRAVLE